MPLPCKPESPSCPTKVTGMGIDPGFRCLGTAVVEWQPEAKQYRLRCLTVVETKKAKKKEMRSLRVADDDQRRLRHFWEMLSSTIGAYSPSVVGVESYAPWPGQMGGNAWKVAFAYQLSICAGWSHGLLPMVFRPDDLKRRFLGKNAGTKVAVEDALRVLVSGFSEELDKVAKTKREHAADAVGHAVLAIEEAERMRAMYGAGF